MSYAYLKSQSQTAYDSVVGVQERVQQKLDGEFENQDKKQTAQFDIGKLEQIKEKANKNFFENMETRKKGKAGANAQSNKGGDLLDLDPTDVKPAPKQANTGALDDDDILGFDLPSNSKPAPPRPAQKQADPYGGLDLLDDDVTVHKPKAQDADLMFDFQHNLSVSKPADKKSGGLLDDDMFGDLAMGMRAEDTKKAESKAKAQGNDPFDFMAF